MRAIEFIVDTKKAFWHPLIITLLLISTTAVGQIDYRQHPQTITSKDSLVEIVWIAQAAKSCELEFNHLVTFVNTKNDSLHDSKVLVNIYKNGKAVRNFIFAVGDQNINRIYTHDAIKIKEGDKISFTFQLFKSHNESYVFNIYPEKRAAIKSLEVINEKGDKIVKSDVKEKKYKEISSAKSRRNLRKPMAQYVNGRFQ